MAYKREGRPSFYFTGRARVGWEQLCTDTPNRRLADKMEAMWQELSEEHRAWDVLASVLNGSRRVASLFDLWRESNRDVVEIRRRLADTDVEPLVEEWLSWYRGEVTKGSVAHAEVHVRWLLPKGQPRLVSECTMEWLTDKLSAYGHSRSTRRKVHSSWSSFFSYCVKPKGKFAANPMESVDRPTASDVPIRFYELRDVERIVGWFSAEGQRAYYALIYGTGMDVSDPLPLLRSDINPSTHELRAPGTKNHNRDRVVLVADWAWPTFWAYARDLHPDTRLFPATWDRWKLSDWHRAAIGDGIKDTHGKVVTTGLKLPRRHPLKCARHHWAVRQLRSGAPVRVVSEQLGHATTQQTLDKYGRFQSQTQDRQRAEKQATQFDRARARAEAK